MISKILIVDKQEESQKKIEGLLKKNNFDTAIAASNSNALALISSFVPNLIFYRLSDISEDCLGFCREVSLIEPKISVVIISDNPESNQDDFQGINLDLWWLYEPYKNEDVFLVIGEIQRGGRTKRHEKILLIDNQKITRLIFSKELLKGGYRVITSLLEGVVIEEINLLHPDLIIINTNLEIEAYDFCRNIRLSTQPQDISRVPILMLVDSLVTASEKTKGLGIDLLEYFLKFEGPLQLLKSVNELFEKGKLKKDRKILVADDSLTVQYILKYALEKVGYHVFLANDGEQTLKIFSEQNPDLIILDIEMPALSGIEVCLKLKKDPLNSILPVLILSANTDKEMIRKGLMSGAADYITKPFDLEELLARIEIHLKMKFIYNHLEAKNKELQRLIDIDSLTGLYNRQYLDKMFAIEVKRSIRYKRPMSFVIFDMDFFKKVNDTYGHQVGDVVLMELAQIIRLSIRDMDIAVRYGGEEFCLILPETEKEGALILAERVRRKVFEKEFTDFNLRLTVSLGITFYDSILHNHPCGPAELFSVADQALYRAKEQGRNRIEWEEISQ